MMINERTVDRDASCPLAVTYQEPALNHLKGKTHRRNRLLPPTPGDPDDASEQACRYLQGRLRLPLG